MLPLEGCQKGKKYTKLLKAALLIFICDGVREPLQGQSYLLPQNYMNVIPRARRRTFEPRTHCASFATVLGVRLRAVNSTLGPQTLLTPQDRPNKRMQSLIGLEHPDAR